MLLLVCEQRKRGNQEHAQEKHEHRRRAATFLSVRIRDEHREEGDMQRRRPEAEVLTKTFDILRECNASKSPCEDSSASTKES